MEALQVLKSAHKRDRLNFTAGLVASPQKFEDNATEEYLVTYYYQI